MLCLELEMARSEQEFGSLWTKFESWVETSHRHREIFKEVEKRHREVMLRIVAPMRRFIAETGISAEELLRRVASERESRKG